MKKVFLNDKFEGDALSIQKSEKELIFTFAGDFPGMAKRKPPAMAVFSVMQLYFPIQLLIFLHHFQTVYMLFRIVAVSCSFLCLCNPFYFLLLA